MRGGGWRGGTPSYLQQVLSPLLFSTILNIGIALAGANTYGGFRLRPPTAGAAGA